MKIAMLSPMKKPVGGKEESISAPSTIISLLTEELVKRGHKVTLFAGKDSKTSAKLISCNLRSALADFGYLREKDLYFFANMEFQYELMAVIRAVELASRGEFDIIHGHDHRKLLYFSRFCKVPIILTFHGNIADDTRQIVDLHRLREFYHNVYFVAISRAQRKQALSYLNIIDVVPHGLDLSIFSYNEKPHNYLLFLGRMLKIKGPQVAIAVAKETGKRLILVGDKGFRKSELDFWNKEIVSAFSKGKIDYMGYIPHSKIGNFYQKAKLLINPINWDEPFGLVPVEANACGTPVVAFKRGAMPELIKDGVNGFLVKPGDVNGMVKAVKRIYEMPEKEYQTMRRACRKHVEENFTVEKMVSGYEAVYRKVIEDWKKRSR